jgi:hypothetical protein
MDEAPVSFKVVLTGFTPGRSPPLAGPGVTSVTQRWVCGLFQEELMSTIGCEHHRLRVRPSDTRPDEALLFLWDSSTNERFLTITKSILAGARCIALVIDLSSQIGFESLQIYNEFPDLVKQEQRVVVIGNKCDVAGGALLDNVSACTEFAAKNGLEFVRMSARTGEGAREALDAVARVATR